MNRRLVDSQSTDLVKRRAFIRHKDRARLLQRCLGHRLDPLGQHCRPVAVALAAAHRDLLPHRIDVLHPQPHHFAQPQPTLVWQFRRQAMLSLEPVQ